MKFTNKTERRVKTGLVIMASGLGKRFGSNKLMEPLGGKPLIKWVIDVTDGLFDKRVVVTRSSQVNDLCKSLNINVILHEFPGRNDTVRLGLSNIMDGIDYCFFMQGDQPLISKESINKMLLECQPLNDKILKASYCESIGSPMGFPSCFFDQLLSLPDGKGGNFIAKMHQENVKTIEVFHDYELWDIDTPKDLERICTVLEERSVEC